MMVVYTLDGASIDSLWAFFVQFGRMVSGPGGYLGNDFCSFDDCLLGGFGLANPCVIVWRNATVARQALGYDCLARWCQEQIQAHEYPDEAGLAWLTATMESASRGLGQTMFDFIVDTIVSVKERSYCRCAIDLKIED
jgi:hypothetical protein